MTQLLLNKAEQLDLFYEQYMQKAYIQIKTLADELTTVNTEYCSSELVDFLKEKVFERDEYYIPVVYIKSRQQYCSALGVVSKPENVSEVASYVKGVTLYQLKDLHNRTTLYVGVDGKGISVLRRLTLSSRFRSLLDSSWHLSSTVVSVGYNRWFSLGQTRDVGQTVNVDNDTTPLSFTLSSSRLVQNYLWLFYFILLLGISSFLAWVGFQTRDKFISAYWQYRFSKALKNEEFKLEYQPVIDSRTSEVVGVEAFLRWHHHGREIPTIEFIHHLEKSPTMIPVTLWVLERMFIELKSLLVSRQLPWCSINISVKDIESGLVLNLLEKWHHQDYPLESIAFELTERLPITDWPQTQAFVAACQFYGCKVKLDDVGTGYGSHLYLQKLPLNTIKIDQAFVRLLGTADSKESLVATYVDIARDMNAGVIAEGVETAEQVRILQSLGIYVHQGWYYARSMSADELRSFILTR
ncbi:EAL domain-containing protein [Shewanella sp. SNU WT4]|uniref:EAL domain-containing protein n=1 Tax=Shewanella sp. SNU WT4 TaxID=2590015 RepID=UPI00143DACF2|nr:EAL domain-containing protein [Shewanella sp. SNU WT4]